MKKYILLILSIIIFTGISFAAEYNMHVPLPGNTVANAKLQYDTLMPAYMAVRTKVKSCDKMSVVNTKVTKEPYDLKYNKNGLAVAGKWEEIWYVKACQRQFEVPIKFVLDPTGASYIIPTANIKAKY